MGTGGKPVWYQTAVWELISTGRSWRPYHWATVSDVQAVAGSVARCSSVGSR
jgi:hypothetical protein